MSARRCPSVPRSSPLPGALRGFTLVEVLIALSILALISVLGYRAVAALTASETQLTAESTRWRTLDALLARLDGDLHAAQPRPVRNGSGTEPGFVGSVDAAGESELRFSRAGSEFAFDPGSAGQRLGYRLHDRAVEVLYWPHLDQPASVAPTAYALAPEIAHLQLRYLDDAGLWSDRWPVGAATIVPRAVRVELTLASGATIERWIALR
jgi:general secretion pathway protein J